MSDIEFWDRCAVDLVPDISEELVERMLAQMKPVKRVTPPGRDFAFRYRLIETDGVDRRGVAYTWEPRLGRMVRLYMGDLNSKQIISFHRWGAPVFFKPSLAEVCASINRFVPDWSLIRFFELETEGLGKQNVIGDCHFTRCTLYGEERTNVIDEAWNNDAADVERELAAR